LRWLFRYRGLRWDSAVAQFSSLGRLFVMDKKYISLNFSDDELAKAVADSSPPDGVTVSKPSTIIQASAPAEIFWHVAIEFGIQVSALVVGTWIWEAVKKRAKKRARINREEVALQKRAIVRLVQKEINKYDARKAQEQEDE